LRVIGPGECDQCLGSLNGLFSFMVFGEVVGRSGYLR
jgi:hypothetical protein